MNDKVKAIWSWTVKNVFSYRGFAICLSVFSALFAYNLVSARIYPMAYGADAIGANPLDLLATVTAIGTSLVSAFLGKYLGVSPEIVQAIVAFEKDKSNQDIQRRLGAAIIGYIANVLKQHPDGIGGFILNLLNTLLSVVDDPTITNVLKTAAGNLAASQFAVTAQEKVDPKK